MYPDISLGTAGGHAAGQNVLLEMQDREAAMKISARNVLRGTVKSVTHGAVNSEVVLELPGGVELVSIITKRSAEDLKLAAGSEAYAVVKASNVMIAVD
jgi:molybdopterin-binding protein